MFRKVIGQKPDAAEGSEDQIDLESSSAPTPPAASPAPGGSSPPPPSVSTSAAATSTAHPQRPSAASRNVLSSDVEIKGTVKFTNDLVVDGRIEGEITSDGSLTVGENARLRAEIKTGTVIVYGKVHGNITATERVELKASAEVVGDVKAKTLSIEAGAIFVGRSTVGTPSTPPAGDSHPQGDLAGLHA